MNKTLNDIELAFFKQFSNSDWVVVKHVPNQLHNNEAINVKPKNGENNGVIFSINSITSTFDFLVDSEHVLEIAYNYLGSTNLTPSIANVIAETLKKIAIQNSIYTIYIKYEFSIPNQAGFDYKNRSFYWVGDRTKIKNSVLRQSIQEDCMINVEMAKQHTYIDYFSRIVKQYMTIMNTTLLGKTKLRFSGYNGEFFEMVYHDVTMNAYDRGIYLTFDYKEVDGEVMMKQVLKELPPFAKMKGYNYYKEERFGYTIGSNVKLNEIEQRMLRIYQCLGFELQLQHSYRYSEDDRSWYLVSKQLY
ncbi:hypothetical protein [Paenibacillus sp. An7]|uniref:hypothetical protein n=1 Tax=Paenibacillus sp. An7 TaxID=2689577 RepID=UPI0013582B75|nr:hypothetical protein [Paenibacillus sp. An7]